MLDMRTQTNSSTDSVSNKFGEYQLKDFSKQVTARSRGFRDQNQKRTPALFSVLPSLSSSRNSRIFSVPRSLLRAALAPNPPAMARPPQEAIDTFISITGADEAVAVRKLEVPPKGLSFFPFHFSLFNSEFGIWRNRLVS